LIRSAPEFANPTTLALLDCAWSRYEEKSVVLGKGCRTAPSTRPPAALTNSSASRCMEWPKA
jgi:hypothetical protein